MFRDLLPSAFAAWLRGWGANEVTSPDDMTAAAQYNFGSPRPGVAADKTTGGWSTNALWLEAVVRTNDSFGGIFGQASTTLGSGSWRTKGVSPISSTNQSGVVPGGERHIFSVPAGTNAQMLLRFRAE